MVHFKSHSNYRCVAYLAFLFPQTMGEEPRQDMWSSFLHRSRVHHRPDTVHQILQGLSGHRPKHDFHHNIPGDYDERITRHAAMLQKQRQFQNARDNANRTGQSELISFLRNADRSVTLRDVQHVVKKINLTLSEFRSMTHQSLVDLIFFMDLTRTQESMVLKSHERATSSIFSPGHIGAQSTPNPYFV